MREENPLLRGYIAGLFDGEGCITFRTSRGNLELAVQMEMSQEAPVRFLHSRYGGSLLTRKREGKQASWCWFLSCHIAAAFLSDIAPLLIAKREDMAIALPIVHLLLDRRKRSAYTSTERKALCKAALKMKRLRARRKWNGRQ